MSQAAPALVADIGGTNVRFALAHGADADVALLMPGSVQSFAVVHFDSLVAAARHYLSGRNERPRRAVLAAAGPVSGGTVRITNNPWVIRASEVAQALALEAVRIVNDFAAMSAVLPALPVAALRAIGPPAVPAIDLGAARVYGIMGPGTGLGVGVLVVRDGRARVLETEGGHVSFAPATPEQAAVQRLLAVRFGRVSNERLVCGTGLVNIYHALCELAGRVPVAARPEAVTAAAAGGADPEALHAVRMLVEVLGAAAGDLVLTTGAWEGVYLSGGMVAPLLHWLEEGAFRTQFENKGRFADSLRRVPTVAVLHEYPGLLGAAVLALDERVDTVRRS
ncbi:MAG: glucokinase [Gammaproteobacteria bacterium]|nr:glucokinase [Gammaproteobacteria bacterium]